MTETGTVTGSSDDLVVDVSRCLRMRYSASSCSRCIDICPHGAVNRAGNLTIDHKRCRGCLLCTTVCPAGALEQAGDFSACLTQLAKVPEPVLGCIRTKIHSNATLACLGGLSEEHLLALSHAFEGSLTLNLSRCGDCPNIPIVPQLRHRLAALSDGGMANSNCRIDLVESAQDIHHRDESVDRRSFFTSFRTSLFSSAAVILSASSEQSERRTEYAGKRVPLRRALLNKTRLKLSVELSELTKNYFDSSIAFKENCTKCHGCVAVCPTGALTSDLPDTLPVIDPLICTGCRLCQEFCMDRAVRISPHTPESSA